MFQLRYTNIIDYTIVTYVRDISDSIIKDLDKLMLHEFCPQIYNIIEIYIPFYLHTFLPTSSNPLQNATNAP